jgi:hypothetical protein
MVLGPTVPLELVQLVMRVVDVWDDVRRSAASSPRRSAMLAVLEVVVPLRSIFLFFLLRTSTIGSLVCMVLPLVLLSPEGPLRRCESLGLDLVHAVSIARAPPVTAAVPRRPPTWRSLKAVLMLPPAIPTATAPSISDQGSTPWMTAWALLSMAWVTLWLSNE